MKNKRWITLPVVSDSRPFVSKAVFWAILKEFYIPRYIHI